MPDGEPKTTAVAPWIGPLLALAVGSAAILIPDVALAQGLTAALIGTVSDQQGAAIAGAVVRITSPALIGGALATTTNERGQLRFPSLPPGAYVLEIELQGFGAYREADIRLGGGATIERSPILAPAGVAETIVVSGAGSRIDARDPGFATRFGAQDLDVIPSRRFSSYDLVKAAPGISPTSPAGSNVLVSALGSGVDQNQFLIDGTNVTATGNGVARADPGVDFIQELQIQSVGASVEYGNVQGAVVNVITKSGGDSFLSDTSYFWQTSALTSQPLRRPYKDSETGYERETYRDFSSSVGGPAVRDRLWFFSGYQYQRDSDSQPGTDPTLPRQYEQDKIFAKLTTRLAPGWQMVQSVHGEFWSNPETPSATKPRDATQQLDASVAALNLGHLTYTASSSTVWDVRVGRFNFTQDTSPTSGDPTIPLRIDLPESVWSGGPQQIGRVRQVRTTVKATLSHYQSGLLGADHEWRVGAQVDRGEHRAVAVLPTGASSVYTDGVLSQRTLQQPANSGGRFITAAAFVSDAVRLGSRVTVNPGLRFDHSRAISQEVPEYDLLLQETGRTIEGRGTVDTWNIVSPRVGVVIKLDSAGRTMLRANAGRFSQGMLTGEISAVHPGRTRNTIIREPSGVEVIRDPSQVELDPAIRPPHTDQYSIGIDREVTGQSRYRSRTCARTAATSSAGRKLLAAISSSRQVERRPGSASVEADHPFAGTPFSPDQSRELPADLRRSDRRRRATSVPWLAGVWVLHVVENVRAPAFERHDGRRHTGRHRGFAAGIVRARRHLRAGSERSHQRARPSAQRSAAHAPRHERRRPAAHRRCGVGQPAASQRQALGEDGAHQSDRASPTRADRVAWDRTVVVADLARRPRLESIRCWRSGSCRVAPRRAQCAERHGGREHQDRGVQRRDASVRPTFSSIRVARCSAWP